MPWTKSSHPDYAGQPVQVTNESLKPPWNEEMGLVLRDGAKKYGVGAVFSSPFRLGPSDGAKKTLVFQYEVKLTQGLTCGGAYFKLLRAESDGSDADEAADLSNLHGGTPYSIMFGPDSCGETNKVHLIVQHQNPVSKQWEEKHLTTRVLPEKSDTMSHLYSLVIRAEDDSYEVLVDLESQAKGSLLDDFEPAFNPPAEIDDPTDSKPEDWVDAKKIKDLSATKPEDWDESAPRKISDPDATKPEGWLDDEPAEVADPNAEMPSDWDEDEDGEWEAPTIPNPACEAAPGCGEWTPPQIDNPEYKGKWYPPMIDNPDYIGEWSPKQIPNEFFFEDKHPASSVAPITGVAVEVWTMSGGMRFDNVLLSDGEEEAVEFAKATWKVKREAESQERKVLSKEERLREREGKREAGGLNNLIEVYLADAMDFAQENPWPVLGTLLALVATLVFSCCYGGSKKEVDPADLTAEDIDKAVAMAAKAEVAKKGPAAAAEAAAADEAEEEVAAEDAAAAAAAEKPASKSPKKKKTPKA